MYTACPRSLVQFLQFSHYINLDKTFWAYSKKHILFQGHEGRGNKGSLHLRGEQNCIFTEVHITNYQKGLSNFI